MRNHWALTLFVVSTGVALFLVAQAIAANPPGSQPVRGIEIKEIHTIALPQIAPPSLPDGPNKEKFEINCSTCHSLRYVTMQPRFSKKVWTTEVQKMIDTYKAQFAKEDVEPIVEYLVSAHGTNDTNASH